MSIKTYRKGERNQLTANFNSNEFDCKGNGCCYSTHIDPKLVEYLQQIRTHFNRPIFITSGYRCATHNAKVNGSSGSKHKQGMACDFRVDGVSPAEVCKYAESIGIKGIGIYDNFVHIDTRDYKSFWKGHNQVYVSTFGGTTTNKNEAQKYQSCSFGKKNSDVKLLQERLIALGYDLGAYGADGHFGTKTYIAVCKFQRDNGLTVDGIAGTQTWSKVLE